MTKPSEEMMMIMNRNRLFLRMAFFFISLCVSFVAHQHMLSVYYERCNKNMLTALLFRDSTFCRGLHFTTTMLERYASRVIALVPGASQLLRLAS